MSAERSRERGPRPPGPALPDGGEAADPPRRPDLPLPAGDDPAALASGPDQLLEALRMNARVLQYVHDSHARLVKVLERSDRAEMIIQSTEALNRTFRRLHESQEQLAAALHKERRRQPLLVALAAAVGGFALLFLLYLLVDSLALDLRGEADRFAAARDEDSRRDDLRLQETSRRFEALGAGLVDTVNSGLAANRVLANENRAQHEELVTLKTRLQQLEDGLRQADDERRNARLQVERLVAENDSLLKEVDELRDQSLLREMRGADLRDILGDAGVLPRKAAEGAEGAAGPVPVPGSATADAPVAGAIEAAPPESPQPGPAAAEPPPPAAEKAVPESKAAASQPPFTPEVTAFNRLLADAGVIGLRLLQTSGIRDGAMESAVLEVRENGYPVGCHTAKRLRLEVDPVARSGSILLQEGETTLRGARQPFPGASLSLPIPALAPDSWLDPLLVPIVELRAAPRRPPAAPAEPAARAFDARAVLGALNKALAADGYTEYDFAQVSGVEAAPDGARLLGCRMHVYDGAGALRRTVVAAECRVAVDAAAREVTLTFLDGHHEASGREVPFFRGQGDAVGRFAVTLNRADLERWRAVVGRVLRTEE